MEMFSMFRVFSEHVRILDTFLFISCSSDFNITTKAIQRLFFLAGSCSKVVGAHTLESY